MLNHYIGTGFTSVLAGAFILGCVDAGQMPVQPGDVASTAAKGNPHGTPFLATTPLVQGLQGAMGSAIGPGGALFVTEGAVGRISRIDPMTGGVSTFASGLPSAIIPIGGPVDVAFIGGTAYALVTLVGEDFGTDDIVGIYRVDGPNSFSVIADIGAFNVANPPTGNFSIDFPTGLQYAMEVYRGAFLVTDGHLNRVLHVTRGGEISVFREFDNTVPTGLEVRGNTVYMAEAGAAPHSPEDGRILALGPNGASASVVAAGAPLLVDVKFGRGTALFGLAQGEWDEQFPGSPAAANTGSLVRVSEGGIFSVVADGLNIPTSFQIIGNTAYVVTLTGEIWTVANIAAPPFVTAR